MNHSDYQDSVARGNIDDVSIELFSRGNRIWFEITVKNDFVRTGKEIYVEKSRKISLSGLSCRNCISRTLMKERKQLVPFEILSLSASLNFSQNVLIEKNGICSYGAD